MYQKNPVGWAWAAVLSGAVVSSMVLSAGAGAQWLPDRNYTEGPGVRVGDLELHPGLAVRGGYDTNVFRSDAAEVGSAIVAVTPHLNISTLSKQRAAQGGEAAGSKADSAGLPAVTFNAGLAGTLFYYFEKTAPSNVDFDTTAAMNVLPERRAGFDLSIDYKRTTRPFSAYTGDNVNNKYALDWVKPSAVFRVQSHSGVLKAHVGYSPGLSHYENSTFSYLNSLQHNVLAGASWKFLPYTALVYDAVLGFLNYDDPLAGPAAVIRLSDNKSFQSRLGLNGAITSRLSVRALAGYATVLNKDSSLDDKEDVIGEAAIRYGTDVASGELGYQRLLQVVSLGGWMQQDRGYLESSFLLARAVALNFSAGVAHVNYGRLLAVSGADLGFDSSTGAATSQRQDIRVDAGVHAEYRATNWLAFLADFSALATLTDFEYDRGVGAVPFPAQFKSYQAYGGVRVHY